MNRKLLGAAVAAVLVATAAAYLPSIDGEFQFDDQEIAKTVWVRDAQGFLAPSRWTDMPRPLTGLTFALDHALDGFRPRVWHATNVLVHLAAVLLAWRFARRVLARAGLSTGGAPVPAAEEKGKRRRRGAARPGPAAVPEWPALAVAAIFALHPLQTEAVSYISQRSEALASALYLAGLIALLAYDAAPAGPRRARLLGAAIALHAVALVAKPIAATMPASWLLLAAVVPPAPEQEVPAHRRVLRRIPAALPLLALSAFAALGGVTAVRGSGHAGFDLPFVTPLQYLATQLRALPVYARLLVFPAGLNADWWFPFSRSFLEPAVLGGAAFVGLLTAAAILVWRRAGADGGDWRAVGRLAAFGWLFFLVVLSPTTFVPLRDAFVEHRTYLAVLAIALPLAAAGAVVVRRVAATGAVWPAGAALALAVLLALAAATAARNRVWSSALALWSDASTKAPRKPRIWVNLGTALHFAGRYDEAVTAYDRGLALGDDPTVPLELVVRNTALALVRLHRHDEARVRLERYLRRAPRDAGTIVILALIEAETGRLDDAERSARRALAIDPALSRPYQILGQVQEKRGDLDGAYAEFTTASRIDPADALPVYSIGRIEEKRGRVAEACRAYARATDTLARSSAAQSARAAYARLCAK